MGGGPVNRSDSQLLIWEIRSRLRQLGLTGITGIALLAGCAGVLVAHVGADYSQLEQLDQLSLSLRDRAQRATSAFEASDLSPEEQLARFYSAFPDLAAVPDVLGKIYQAARAEGLSLEQGEYRIAQDQISTLRRYRITFPVKGSYVQVRQFLAKALRDAPFVALDSVSFQRESIGLSSVEAQVRLTIYLGSPA